MWKYGCDYLQAATHILSLGLPHPFVPYYVLLGQSIELFLKAYLLQHGMALTDLKKKFGHNLETLGACAREFGLQSEVSLSSIQWAAMNMLGREYMEKRYQYSHGGKTIVPTIQLVHEAAEALRECTKMVGEEIEKDNDA